MGVESGSQRILDAMDKGLLVSEVVDARQRLKDAGIRACYFLQFGYPGETWKDIQQTIALVRLTHPHDIGVSVSYPLPNTRFYEKVQAELGHKRNWTDSDDLCCDVYRRIQRRRFTTLFATRCMPRLIPGATADGCGIGRRLVAAGGGTRARQPESERYPFPFGDPKPRKRWVVAATPTLCR